MDASIAASATGKFLKALVREEIQQDKDWVVRLRTLPDAPETFYLTALMASHDFQTALQNYLDLEDLRRKLVAWQGSFDAFDDLIRLRRAELRAAAAGDRRAVPRARLADAPARRAARTASQALQDMLTAPRPELPGDRGRAHRRSSASSASKKPLPAFPRHRERELQRTCAAPEGRADLDLADRVSAAADRGAQAPAGAAAPTSTFSPRNTELRPHATGRRAQLCRL